MADRASKVLRVGLIRGGKIVEERVLPPRAPLTIGTGPRNTIVVPEAGLPASVQVFSWHRDRYTLHFAEGVEGRIEGPRGGAEFGALVGQGFARRAGNAYAVPVGEDQRGKIVLGEVTVLWQLVPPQPEPPKPVLPREARGNHFRSMDRLFVVVLLLSLLLHGGAWVALANVAPPKDVTLEEIPDRYARVLLPEKQPRPAPEKRAEPQRAEAAPEAKREPERTPEPARDAAPRPVETPEQAAARQAARAAAVARAVQSRGLLKVLGALGPGTAEGAVADVFGAGGATTDVATALAGAGGVVVASDPAAVGGRKGGGQGGAASIGDLATSGGGDVKYGAKSEVRVTGTVATEQVQVEVDSTEIDQGKLAQFVRARSGLIVACYESALKRNPGLRGKITVRFTILQTGAVSDVETAADTLGAPEVAACIAATLRTWRTPFRPGGPVTVEYPFLLSPASGGGR
jgi:outer membrane biosynthesis protein TonB